MTEMGIASTPPAAPASGLPRTTRGGVVGFAVVSLVALWAARWFWRARYLYEWDSAQYALGILRFDVRNQRPHPPGYPLWIVLLKATHLLVKDVNTAQIALGFVVTGVATALFYRVVRRLYGEEPALLAAAWLLFSPTVIFYSTVASSYPADLLVSTVLAPCRRDIWTGDNGVGLWAVFAIALLAGVRQSGAVRIAPLIGVSLLRALVIAFPGVAGKNRVTFDYSRWNHHPDEFAPLDPRPFGVAFRAIRCELGTDKRLLFSL